MSRGDNDDDTCHLYPGLVIYFVYQELSPAEPGTKLLRFLNDHIDDYCFTVCGF